MLKENIKSLRKSKGLSQEELAIKLNVVRQTISKWEQGLSVPDAEMLIKISEVFDTPVSTFYPYWVNYWNFLNKKEKLKYLKKTFRVSNIFLVCKI